MSPGGVPLADYVDLFDVAADKIYQYSELKYNDEGLVNYHPIITG
jgi:hypothetical protein